MSEIIEFEGKKYRKVPETDLCAGCAFASHSECPPKIGCLSGQFIVVPAEDAPATESCSEMSALETELYDALIDLMELTGTKTHKALAAIAKAKGE